MDFDKNLKVVRADNPELRRGVRALIGTLAEGSIHLDSGSGWSLFGKLAVNWHCVAESIAG